MIISQNKMMRNTMRHTDYYIENTSLPWKKNSRRKLARIRHVTTTSCTFRIPWHYEFSPIEFLKGLAERVTRAMCFGSVRGSLNRSSSSIGRSKLNGASSVDYYRAAAVEDCIEFIHTSFSRSNSLTTTTTTPRDEFMHAFLRNFESQTL